MADLDVEMELDLTFDAAPPAEEQSPPVALQHDHDDNAMAGGGEEIQPNKIVITGLNEMHPTHVKAYVRHYFGELKLIEWINDTSANLVFDTPETATDALRAMSAVEIDNPLESRSAQPHADPQFAKYDLSLRQSLVTDVKKRGAHLESRFYLLNPEYDPENRKQQRDRRGRDDRRRPRRTYRDPDAVEGDPSYRPDVDIYSDDPTRRDRLSRSSSAHGEPTYTHGRRMSGYGRDRSASPTRADTGRYRSRSRHNRDRRDDRQPRDLFEGIAANRSILGNGHDDRPGSTEMRAEPRELFPHKVSSPGHRRQDAQSLHPTEVATAIGHDPHRPAARDLMSRIGGGDLMSRINNGPNTNHGRLSSDDNYTFRGASNNPDAGFSFRGASEKKARELFPDKVRKGNGRDEAKPRDLMDGIIKPRRRAEDYDY